MALFVCGSSDSKIYAFGLAALIGMSTIVDVAFIHSRTSRNFKVLKNALKLKSHSVQLQRKKVPVEIRETQRLNLENCNDTLFGVSIALGSTVTIIQLYTIALVIVRLLTVRLQGDF
jgi:hypothetical protein